MKKTKEKFYSGLIGRFFILAVFALPVSFVQAQSVVVDFESNPLFNVANFMPGDIESRHVEVTNGTAEPKVISTEAVNVNDNDSLASEMNIRILEGPNVLYADSFAAFLSSGGVNLSSIAPSDNSIYIYEISFLSSSDDHQGSSLGFDLCIGFQGGNLQCGDTVVGNGEIQSSPLSGTSSSGGGGPSSPHQLSIFNEQSSIVSLGDPDSNSGDAIIIWDTNLLSTSQVIYGLASGGPYSLDLNLPNFGYPFGTIEDPIKVIHHSVSVGGLTPGETYVFRTVSRASPPTVSFERKFTVAYTEASSLSSGKSEGVQNILSVGSDSVVSRLFSFRHSSSPSISAPLNGVFSNKESNDDNKVYSTKNSNLATVALSGLPGGLSKFFSAKYITIFSVFLLLTYFLWLFALKIYSKI